MTRVWLFVGDHLANCGDALFDSGDFFGPGASGVVRVRDSGSVFAFGFGEMVEEDVESVLQGGAGHDKSLSLRAGFAAVDALSFCTQSFARTAVDAFGCGA